MEIKVVKADTFWKRLKGLLGRKSLEAGEALWITPCHQVHMIGMKFPISVWFLDKNFNIIKIINNLPIGAISPSVPHVTSVLELPVNYAKEVGVTVGDAISLLTIDNN